MADNYGDQNRRQSHPNLSWTRQPSPPRPQGPIRSSTMNPTRDPRKRNQSRSPEGTQARKQSRLDPSRDDSTVSSPRSDSRRGSLANGITRQLNIMSPESNDRRPSAQLNTDLRKEADSLFVNTVNSPDSRASLNGEAASGRSTPQNKPTKAVTFSAPIGEAVDVEMRNIQAPNTGNPLIDLLTRCFEQSTAIAVKQVASNEAAAHLSQTGLEYNGQRKNFNSFPAIYERKRKERDEAQKRAKSAAYEFSEYNSSRRHMIAELATLIGQANERTDQVSRAEFDEQKAELRSAHSAIAELRSELSRIKDVAARASNECAQIPQLKTQIERLEKSESDTKGKVMEVEKFKLRVENSLQNLNKLQVSSSKDNSSFDGRIAEVEKKAQASETKFQEYKVQQAEATEGVLTNLNELRSVSTKNLSSSVDRIEEIKQIASGLEKEIQAVKRQLEEGTGKHLTSHDSVRTLSTKDNSSFNGDMEETQKSVHSLEKDFEGFKADQILKDEMIEGHITELLGPLSGRIEKVEVIQKEDAKGFSDSLENFQRNVEDLYTQLNDTVSAATFEAFETKTAAAMKDVKDQITAAQQQRPNGPSHSRTNTPVANARPGPPQFAAPSQPPGGFHTGSPQLPNGAGFGGPSPQVFGSPRHSGMTPPNGMIQQAQQASSFGQLQWQDLRAHIDAIYRTLGQLKTRFDNLTTDEMAQKMMDQASQMYPFLKNVDNMGNTINHLLMRVNAIEGSSVATKETAQQAQKLVQEVIKTAQEATNMATQASKSLDTAEDNIVHLQGAVAKLNKDPKKGGMVTPNGVAAAVSVAETSINGINGDTLMLNGKPLEECLQPISKAAFAADKLSKGHSTRFSKLEPEAMKSDIEELKKTVASHSKKLVDGEQTITGLKTDVGQMKTDVEDVKDRIVTYDGKVEAMEAAMAAAMKT